MILFRIKICGITRPGDAMAAVEHGADAIGLNFYRRSLRFVTVQDAQQISTRIRGRAMAVGVFVDSPTDEINRIATEVPLDLIQLHGDQPPDVAAELIKPVVRAIRVPTYEDLVTQATIWREVANCHALLVDTFRPDRYGGTGHTSDWSWIPRLRTQTTLPLVLAGGLTPENVARAVAVARPDALDVAGGVELLPGQKDPQLVQQFIARAHTAFEESDPSKRWQ